MYMTFFRFNTHGIAHCPFCLIDHRQDSLKLCLAREDDFFSWGSDIDRSLFLPSSRKPIPNATWVTLSDFNPKHSFSDAIAFPRIVKPGSFGFKPEFETNVTQGVKFVDSSSNDGNTVVDLNFDPASLRFFIVFFFSVMYAYTLSAFIITYAWAHGIIFIKVVDHLLGNYRSFSVTVRHGVLIGLTRLLGVILMKWAVRNTLAQLVGLPFFWKVDDQCVFLNVFLRMQFMPFVDLAPWVTGHERESGRFIVIWFLIDLTMGLMYDVDSWVAIMDTRRGVRELVGERRNMLVTLFYPAFEIRLLEAIVCGSIGRWMLRGICGEVLTMAFQSLMEVYFTVAWLVFYVAARCRYDSARGRTFGRTELEGRLLNVDI